MLFLSLLALVFTRQLIKIWDLQSIIRLRAVSLGKKKRFFLD
jgi:hypothetical protein